MFVSVCVYMHMCVSIYMCVCVCAREADKLRREREALDQAINKFEEQQRLLAGCVL